MDNKYRQKIFFYAVAGLLLAISSFMHFWKIGDVPNGFFFDEVSIGYNAWSIGETGANEYGDRYPVFFHIFDKYYNEPVMIYTLVPLVKVFGLGKAVIRLPSGIFIILAGIAFYFLSYKLTRSRWTSVFSAFIFTVVPCGFAISRSSMSGFTPMLLGITAGFYFLFESLSRKSFWWPVASAFFLVLAMYSHTAGRPAVFIALVCFALAFNMLLLKRWRIFLVFLSSCVFFLLPMFIALIRNPHVLTSRINEISLWKDAPPIYELACRICSRYLDYFSPEFLFISGDAEPRHNACNAGGLYVFMLPFVVAGIFYTIREFRRNPYCRFILLALLSYPTAAVVTMDRMHGTRTLSGLPFWCVISVLGFCFIWKNKVKLRPLVIAVLCFSVIEISSYFVSYFGSYALKSRSSFFAPFVETLEASFPELGKGDTLYVSNSVFPHPVDKGFKPTWYIYFLLLGNIHPAVYQKAGIPEEHIQPYEGKTSRPGILIRMNSVIKADDGGNVVAVLNSEPLPPNSKLIRKIPLSVGSDRFFEVYRVYGIAGK
ncbi:MAG: glycosyltransferase family 39 protein [Victivallales bacterium]|jgi:hypothetical protein